MPTAPARSPQVPLGGVDAQYERGAFYPGCAAFCYELAAADGHAPEPVAVLTARAQELAFALALDDDDKVVRKFRETGSRRGTPSWGVGVDRVRYGSLRGDRAEARRSCLGWLEPSRRSTAAGCRAGGPRTCRGGGVPRGWSEDVSRRWGATWVVRGRVAAPPGGATLSVPTLPRSSKMVRDAAAAVMRRRHGGEVTPPRR